MTLVDDLCKEFWDWRVRNYQEFATAIGVHSHDGELEDMSLQAYDSRLSMVGNFLAKVKELQKNADLTEHDKLNLQLLGSDFELFIAGSAYKSFLFPVNQLEGPQTDFPRLVSYMKTDSSNDFEMILERYRQFPNQVDQMISLLESGRDEKYVMSIISIKPVPNQISSLISKPAEELPFFDPFRKAASGIDETLWKHIVEKAKALISDVIVPAFKKLSAYLETTYIPNARSTIGARDLPNGDKYYQKCLEFHTTTVLSAQEIHEMGKGEVKRINERMEGVRKEVKFEGTLKEFCKHLRADEKLSFKNKEDILDRYRKICDVIKEKLPSLFQTFPVAKFEIIQVPDEIAPNFPGAYYLAPPGDGSRPGTFYVNTYKPETRKSYEMVSLALHEAIPGHHHQSALSIELKDVPEFRRYLEDRHYYEAPARFAMNTAYIEGWGLYSEYLGEELGLYKDPYDLFGRLSHEMLRAVRLVVDTGMHALGWSREESIAYMLSNTAMSNNDAVAEVERYITWPGQACAYKIGELKLKELRDKATQALGDKFDIKAFHDVVLLSGSLPLTILEKQVDDYIARVKDT